MNLMLLALFASILVGLLGGRQVGRRETRILVGIASALTLIYFLRPTYMT
jgi:hypothetical protein